MGLIVFERAIQEVVKQCENASFSELIRTAREALGIKQCRAAEFIGVSQQRLGNLETGYYRDLPSPNELKGLSQVYNLNFDLLAEKAKQHVCERIIARKVKVPCDIEEV